MSNTERTIRVIAEQLGLTDAEITREKSLVADLQMDSLDSLELVMAIEDEFMIEISDEDAEKLQTVGGVIDYVNERVPDGLL